MLEVVGHFQKGTRQGAPEPPASRFQGPRWLQASLPACPCLPCPARAALPCPAPPCPALLPCPALPCPCPAPSLCLAFLLLYVALAWVVWPPQTAWGGKEKKNEPSTIGSSGESPNYDALEIALSLENPLMRHSTANPKPQTLSPKP